MKTMVGGGNCAIEINLSTDEITTFEIDTRDRRDYLGGLGLGLKLLYERLEKRCDPLGPDNWLAVGMGALMGSTAPCSGRFSLVTKSPLTGIMVHASCGGPFGMACKTAGFDTLLITGRARSPVIIRINAGGASIEAADALWGCDTDETQQRLNPKGLDGILTIGPAGENRVLFANAASGNRSFGRGGVGAVMGAKYLKAIVALGGSYRVLPANPKRFTRAKKRATAYIRSNPVTAEEYRHFGTLSHVGWCNDGGILPVENFRKGTHPDAQQVSGRAFHQRYNSRPSSCRSCSIICGHKGTLADGTSIELPGYESVVSLGTNLGIVDPDVICALNTRCAKLGLDTISAGGVLAWCMEAGEKGLIETPLRVGESYGLEAALDDMAYRRGWGNAMADGTRRLSQRYGGTAFAIQVKGLEMPAYDPRGAWGQGLSYAVANRGACHRSASVFIPEVALGLLDPSTRRAKARFVWFFENLYAALDALVTCPHTAYAYLLEPRLVRSTPSVMLRMVMQYLPWLAIRLINVGVYARLWQSMTGIGLSQRQMLKAGERIHVLERLMNTGEGISRKDDTLPVRMLTEGRLGDEKNRTVPLTTMLDAYYRLRGYDPLGIPTHQILKRLGIVNRWPADADPRMVDFKMINASGHPLKRRFLAMSLWFLGRAIQAAARVDRQVRQEFDAMPDGFTFTVRILPNGPAMVIGKGKEAQIRYLGGDPDQRIIDLTLGVKSITIAMRLFTLREATVTALARGRIVVDGDIAMACRVVRILDRVEVYLLPRHLAERAVRRYPHWPVWQMLVNRCLIYLRTIAGF